MRARPAAAAAAAAIRLGPPPPYLRTHMAKVARRHLADWIVLLLLAAADVGLNLIEPFHRFVHKDMLDSLLYPLHDNTVPVWAVPILAVATPMLIFVGQYVSRKNAYDLHHAILGLLFSVLITGVLTDAIKDGVGRPRPNFFWRCLPDGVLRYNNFTGQLNCNGDAAVIKEGYKSFPSGRTSWSFAGLGFLSWYLAGKTRAFDQRGHVYNLCIVIMPLLIAAMVGVSRVADYWHHWQDVFAGGILGLVVASFCYLQFFPNPAGEHENMSKEMATLPGRGIRVDSSAPQQQGVHVDNHPPHMSIDELLKVIKGANGMPVLFVPSSDGRLAAVAVDDLQTLLTTNSRENGSAERNQMDLRAWLLLFTTLVATVTFTAGLTPPGGFWAADDKTNGYVAGTPVMRDKFPTRYSVYYYSNTTALFLSLMIIVMLASNKSNTEAVMLWKKYFFLFLVGLCYVSLGFSYGAGTWTSLVERLYTIGLFLVVVTYMELCVVRTFFPEVFPDVLRHYL